MHVALPTVLFVAGWLFWSLLRTKAVEMHLRIKTTQEDLLLGESMAPSGCTWSLRGWAQARGSPSKARKTCRLIFFNLQGEARSCRCRFGLAFKLWGVRCLLVCLEPVP